MGHSYVQMPIHQLGDQRAIIGKSLDALERFTGKRPVGWLGPGLTETYETPDLLTEAGVKYVGDFVYDDEPTIMTTAHGPLVTLPYTVELNDIPMMIVQHHASHVFVERFTDQLDRLYREGAERAKIMAVAVHPYISGVPHRIRYFEEALEYASRQPGVVFWSGERILEWYLGATRR
jgi:peptidoglycan/xylan/chitin deacetylase (PgdA/CDA1 family)